MGNLLEIRDIHTFIGQFHILEGVSVEVPEGSIVALLGRNGAGKTTTLKSVLGLTPPRQGRIILDGQEIQGRRSFDIAAMGIGFVPEHRAIFRDLSSSLEINRCVSRPRLPSVTVGGCSRSISTSAPPRRIFRSTMAS